MRLEAAWIFHRTPSSLSRALVLTLDIDHDAALQCRFIR